MKVFRNMQNIGTRWIKGERFRLLFVGTSRREAERKAEMIRNRGYHARVIDTAAGWGVYEGGKRKKR
ncbi:hypothetical protein DRN85_10570 [Methanosarcinales archaeon]|nr:MAG: hypothetical protein DRN85_10570 [Methanosarcinales archaeon]